MENLPATIATPQVGSFLKSVSSVLHPRRKTKPSHVLVAMGANEDEATSAIRVSLGWNSTEEDAEAFIREWSKAYERIKTRSEQKGAA